MFFSIITPIYNVEKYIERGIQYILGQTFEDFELILSDDGSTDQSAFLCDEFAKKDGRIVVIHAPNMGVGEASLDNSYELYS